MGVHSVENGWHEALPPWEVAHVYDSARGCSRIGPHDDFPADPLRQLADDPGAQLDESMKDFVTCFNRFGASSNPSCFTEMRSFATVFNLDTDAMLAIMPVNA